jgi:hypothetical protein
VASWPKLQWVNAAVRPDVSHITTSSVSSASVLSVTVSVSRSSVRLRRSQAAS